MLFNLKGAARVVRGLFLLACGRPAGIAMFGNTVEALTTSLSPLIAFPFVGAGILAIDGQPEAAALAFISRLCVVLAISVITFEFAKMTGREALWLRTATALNWSFWMMVPLLLLAGILGGVLVTANVPQVTAEKILIGLMGAYMLWYHWFTVRSGLKLGVWQAVALVLLTNGVIGLLVVVPMVLDLSR